MGRTLGVQENGVLPPRSQELAVGSSDRLFLCLELNLPIHEMKVTLSGARLTVLGPAVLTPAIGTYLLWGGGLSRSHPLPPLTPAPRP